MVRIMNKDCLKKCRDCCDLNEPVPNEMIDTVVPVIVMNQDTTDGRVPTSSTISLSGDTAIVNSTTANKTTISVHEDVEADTRTLVEFGNGKAGTAITAGTPVTLYTVTAGKTFYLTYLSVGSGLQNNTVLKRSGTDIGSWNNPANQPTPQNFSTPLKFTAGQTVQIDVGTNQTIWYIGSGWEE